MPYQWIGSDPIWKAIGSGVIGRSVEQEHRRPQRPRPDDLPRTHDPAEVRDPEQGLVLMEVRLVGHLLGHLDQEAPVDVDRPLRPAGRS